MRISVDARYGGYRTFLEHGGHATKWVVTLNGVEVRDCVVADEETGEVLVTLQDGVNTLKVDENGEFVRRWMRGQVVISRVGVAPDGGAA